MRVEVLQFSKRIFEGFELVLIAVVDPLLHNILEANLTLESRNTGVSVRGAGGSAGEPEDGEPGVEDEEHQKGAQ